MLVWWWLTRRIAGHTAQPQAATEETLQQTIADLSAIQQLLPSLPAPQTNIPVTVSSTFSDPGSHFVSLPLTTMLRILAYAYPPYLLLTLSGLIRMQTLLAIAGSLVIIHRAPFALIIRRALWRSAYFRWGVYWAWAKISGSPLPGDVRSISSEISVSVAASTKSTSESGSSDPKTPANHIRFLYTVYENQRWWMGLDFTAALLPGERPSWCSRSLQPCPPPAAFSLPPPTTVYVPEPVQPSKQGKGKDANEKVGKKRVMKRTAVWSWEEPEWRVVVHKEGSNGTTRVERPLPSLVEEGAGASANRILRAAGKIRGASVDLSPEQKLKELDAKDGFPAKDGEKAGEKGEGELPAGQGEAEEEPFTDADGWVYGDNKWEGGSAKGGLGKVSAIAS